MKYFVVVAALFLVQIVAGAVVAHYGVEGDGFYGIPLSRVLPYSLTRTWHVQLGLFWIATSWLAAGLFIGPLVGGVEPRGQRLGVNVLFAALVAVVVGSLAGEYLSIHGRLSDAAAFYWGHQGWEYLDLGRVWQSGLFLGLLIWLALMLRIIWPALSERGERRDLLAMFALSAGAIALFWFDNQKGEGFEYHFLALGIYELGTEVYGSMGITIADTARHAAALMRNFDFFGAPLAGMVSMHRDLGPADALSVGTYLQTLMLGGLGTCLEVSVAEYPDVVRTELNIPPELTIVCGLAVGYPDPDFAANKLRIGRDPVEKNVAFVDD